jgi:hypothetical protein
MIEQLLLVAIALAGLYVLGTSVHRIPTGQIGIVRRRFGNSPADRYTVSVFGSAGPQADTLRSDRLHILPGLLYRVDRVPRTHVPPNTIGVVVALAGEPRPPYLTLCRHVECNYFQDGRAFLLAEGQQGNQPAILPGGATYDVNPMLFRVLTVDTIGGGRDGLTAEDLAEINVPEGCTGVVIAREGERPDDEDGAVGRSVPGHEHFQLPWAFLDNGGQRGVQMETLPPGVYRINPWLARVSLIPTRQLILEWKQGAKPATNFDAELDEIVVNCEGHRLQVEVKQTIRIPAEAAPRLVSRFGEQGTDSFGVSVAADRVPVQRFVDKVLGGTVEGYLHQVASEIRILDFRSRRGDIQMELEGRIRQALSAWYVEAGPTFLGEFRSMDPEIDRLLRDTVGYEHAVQNLPRRTQIAHAEAGMERARRAAEVAEVEELVRVLGRDAVTTERWLAQLREFNVPHTVGMGAEALLQYTTLPVIHEMVDRVLAPSEPAAALWSPAGQDEQLAPPASQEPPNVAHAADRASYQDYVGTSDWDGLTRYLSRNRRHLYLVLQAMVARSSLGFPNQLTALHFLLERKVIDESHVRDMAAMANMDAGELLPPATP